MKKLVSVLMILFVLIYSSKAQLLIGTIENDKPILSLDNTKLLSNYNTNLLKASGIDGKFTNVSIKCFENKYYLVFEGSNCKSTFSVNLEEANLFVNDNTSCTTTDCSSEPLGCVPVLTACTACSNKGKCTKTISLDSLLEE